MSLANVLKVLRKELRETLRDRRTIIVMVIVPVFLYPVLLVVIEQMAIFGQRSLEEVPVRVGVVDADAEVAAFLAVDSALVLVPAREPLEDRVRDGRLNAAVRFEAQPEDPLASARAEIVYDASRDRSRRAQEMLRRRLREMNDSLLATRLSERGLPRSFAEPLEVAQTSVATPERLGGYALGRFLPLLLMMMTLLGAFFPAIDLTAGEKERGTLETLLTSPLTNREIVTGKFVTVVIVAVAAAALNLGSMLLTFQSGIFQLTRQLDLQFELPALTVVLVLVCLVPLAVFFAAVFMGIAVRAQSFKEAQNSLTPVQFAALVPMYIPLIPGIPFSYGVAAIPIGGIGMMFREMMSGSAPIGQSAVAVVATVVYAMIALRFAAVSFGKEEVLFGSGTEGSAPISWRERIAGWRSSERDVPGAAGALLLVGLVGLLYFYVGIRLQVLHLERGLFASQWMLLALPAVAFAVLGPFRARETLALRRAPPRAFGAALLIVLGGIPIGWVLGWLQTFFLEIPEEFLAGFEELLAADSPERMAWLLLLVAVTPAICEELVFRGILLQGLSSEMIMRRAVLASALVFGAFHLSFETVIRFLPTAWLGLLFAFVVWHTRSVFTSMLMHFVNNAAILVLVANAGLQAYVTGPAGEPRWIAVAVGVVVLTAGLRILPKRGHDPAATGTSNRGGAE